MNRSGVHGSAPASRVTLLTDFGTADGYVAAMKGVIAAIAPHAVVDDAAHDIPPGDVHSAAWVLAAYWHLYPRGTTHVVVVDPGVGSARRAIAARLDGRFLVGPDNGVLTRVLAAHDEGAADIVEISNTTFVSDVVSATFHGRDVFAPAAAHLARGVALSDLGPALTDPVRLTLVPARRDADGAIAGEVVHVDRFGNLITNIPAEWLPAHASVRVGQRDVRVRQTYGDVASGEVVALVGSRGVLELSVRDGSAAALLAAARADAVIVR